MEFASIVNLDDVKQILDRQISYNMNIALEGLNNNYGANIGKTIIKYSSGDIIQYTKALAAAGSDARMNGCDMPVVINSGSGNQGITCSVPLVAFAEKNKIDKDTLYRALVVSNLCTIHIKNSIGKLSAFCGVVIAGAGALDHQYVRLLCFQNNCDGNGNWNGNWIGIGVIDMIKF